MRLLARRIGPGHIFGFAVGVGVTMLLGAVACWLFGLRAGLIVALLLGVAALVLGVAALFAATPDTGADELPPLPQLIDEAMVRQRERQRHVDTAAWPIVRPRRRAGRDA